MDNKLDYLGQFFLNHNINKLKKTRIKKKRNFKIGFKNLYTNLGRYSNALRGSPAPSTIQGNSGDPLLWQVDAPDVIISFNLA